MKATNKVKCSCGTELATPTKSGRPPTQCAECSRKPHNAQAVETPTEETREMSPARQRRQRIETAVAVLNREWHEWLWPQAERLYSDVHATPDALHTAAQVAAIGYYNNRMRAIYLANPAPRRSTTNEENDDV